MSFHDWAIPVASTAASLFLGARGQSKANEHSLQIAREQMAFQERMSSSAYQRSMQDMRAAGLNPMLAYQQGGASSPQGASATMRNVMEGVSTSALQTSRLKADLKQVSAQTSLLKDREWSQLQDRAESRSRQDLYDRQSDVSVLQKKMFELSLPQMQNAARVERSRLGGSAAFAERMRQALFGGARISLPRRR